jgi:hypothetical protein
LLSLSLPSPSVSPMTFFLYRRSLRWPRRHLSRSLVPLWSGILAQPQRDVGWLHGLPHHPDEVVTQGIEIRLVSKLGREGRKRACPSSSCTNFGFTPLERRTAGQVCRRSWKRISGSPTFLRGGLKLRRPMLEGSSGVPISEANTSPHLDTETQPLTSPRPGYLAVVRELRQVLTSSLAC